MVGTGETVLVVLSLKTVAVAKPARACMGSTMLAMAVVSYCVSVKAGGEVVRGSEEEKARRGESR